MRTSIHAIISSLFIVATSVAFAATGPPTEVTPQNMSAIGLKIECRFRINTIKEGDKPTRPTGVVLIQVIFDADKGPLIKDMDSASLVIGKEDRAMWIPVQWSSGQHPGFIQFSIPEDMIANSSIVLTQSTKENPPSFVISLQKFRP